MNTTNPNHLKSSFDLIVFLSCQKQAKRKPEGIKGMAIYTVLYISPSFNIYFFVLIVLYLHEKLNLLVINAKKLNLSKLTCIHVHVSDQKSCSGLNDVASKYHPVSIEDQSRSKGTD